MTEGAEGGLGRPPPSVKGGGEGEGRGALAAALLCYFIWGIVPLVFQVMGKMGISSWEILANRTVWAVPPAFIFVLLARQFGEVRAAFRTPRTLAWLALSALLIGANWAIYIWAVNSGRVLETSLGYYLTPLINMAAGAAIFHERIDRIGLAAIALAVLGVAIQALALGHLPVVSLVLGLSFGGYGIVRKRVAASAQTGLLIECLMLAGFGVAYLAWLQATGASHLGGGVPATAWLLSCGLWTAVPLVLFSWAARRIPLSSLAFLQFIGPTTGFIIGVAQGEPFTALRGLSFAVIWSGAAVFAFGAWRATQQARRFANLTKA